MFIGKALFLAILWKLIYITFLMSPRLMDKPLTNHVGLAAAFMLNQFSGMHHFKAYHTSDTTIMEGQLQITQVCKIVHENKKVLHIADGCNGLELMVLYAGFILCFPTSISKKMSYLLIGLSIIDIMNILRCAGLGFIKEYYHPYFSFSHHFIFKAIIYTAIVILWVQYCKNKTIQNVGKSN